MSCPPTGSPRTSTPSDRRSRSTLPRARVVTPLAELIERLLGARTIFIVQALQILILHVLDRCETVLGPADRDDQFGKLELDRERVAVLGVLDQKHHQECDDGGRRVDDELPGIAEAEERTRDRPDQNAEQGNQ